MKYAPPIGSTDPNAGYVDRTGNIPGSPVPAAAVESPMREIEHCIQTAGLTPDGADLTQLAQAIDALIMRARPKLYELCEFYYFRHPDLKPGFLPAQGSLIANADTLYPDAWEYLTKGEGRILCKPETEWQAMTTATWATLADGTKVGWNGIGGAPFYAPNTATGALRLPDLRGMYAEAAGFDGLVVGSVHGDASRQIAGGNNLGFGGAGSVAGFSNLTSSGVLYGHGENNNLTYAKGEPSKIGYYNLYIDSSRVVPTAAKNQPRAWGALACVYLGMPSS